MRLKLIAIVVTALSCSGLVIDDLSLANHQPQGLSVTNSATLRELQYADGSRITDVYDGFELKYKILAQRRFASATPDERSALAIKDEKSGLANSSEDPTVNGNTTTAVVRTSDTALEITSYFTFIESPKRLLIQRTFRNASLNPVRLLAVKQYVDPRLSHGPLRAGLRSGSLSCYTLECRVPPPSCPPYCEESSSIDSYSTARLNSSPTHKSLSWSRPITLNPGRRASIVIHASLE